MAKVLLIGALPPQLMRDRKVDAANYRTWQFLEPLTVAGHAVVLCADCAPGDVECDARSALPDLAGFHPIVPTERRWAARLQAAHDRFRPDCIVAVNFFPCLYATKLRTDRPLWMDVYGDQITIQQSFCYRAASDRGLPTTIRFMKQVLQSGDVFSVCGEPQKHMLVGELAMSNRLNRATFGFDFLRVILPGASGATAAHAHGRASLRSRLGLSLDDFAVLWCGGYNTWTDVDTLFSGVEDAMSRDARIHYVSLGASTYEAAGNVYDRLRSKIDRSPNAARYHLLGWQPWSEVAQYYGCCDVGLNIDAMHYETLYGTRTRLVEMIAAGLPVITSQGTELSGLLRDLGAGLTFTVGNSNELHDRILRLAADPSLLERLSRAAARVAEEELSFQRTTEPLRDWVRAPTLAPDREHRGRLTPLAAKHHVRGLLRHVAWQVTGRDR
jgi:glycosyltransferase involved in cell wall biosynthesis